MEDPEKEDLDIYEDLPNFRYDETLDKLNASIAKLEADNMKLIEKLTQMGLEKRALKSNCRELSINISSLLKTARLEIARKERMINELRTRLNCSKHNLKERSSKKPCRRDREETYCKIKSRRRESVERLKRPRSPEKCQPKRDPDVRIRISDITTTQNITSPEQPCDPPLLLKKSDGKLKENVFVPVPSVKPNKKLPTLFSARMYRKLSNWDAMKAEETVKNVDRNGVAAEEVKVETSTGCNELNKTKVASAPPSNELATVLQKIPSIDVKPNSNDSAPLPRVIQNEMKNTASIEKTNVEVNVEVNMQETRPPVAAKLGSSSLVETGQPQNDAKELLPALHVVVENSSVTMPEKDVKVLCVKKPANIQVEISKRKRIPNLPPFTRTTVAKNAIAPISNRWNCAKAISDKVRNKQVDQTKPADDKSEHQKAVESIFGSPVKWADDCSESSHKEEPTINKHRDMMYNLFGSPYEKGADSSSETSPNINLPSTAYEDSCSTVQIPNGSIVSNRHSTKADSVQETRSNFPPPTQPVLRKLKDSKSSSHSVINTVHEDRSLGLMFPFKNCSKYEDTVLGQFDDTAQFVSALARVESKLSPLKSSDMTLDSSTSSAMQPISFKEVFQNKPLACAGDSTNQTVPSLNIPAKEPVKSVLSSKFIHRSNFTSSSVFSSTNPQSIYSDKPINVLQPRKTPRTVSQVAVADSVKCLDKEVKFNARIAINDSFVTEQEERVKKWEEENKCESLAISPRKSPKSTKNQGVSPIQKSVKTFEKTLNVDVVKSQSEPSVVNMIMCIASKVVQNDCAESVLTKLTSEASEQPCEQRNSNAKSVVGRIVKPILKKTSNFKRSSSWKSPSKITKCIPLPTAKPPVLYRRKSSLNFQPSPSNEEVIITVNEKAVKCTADTLNDERINPLYPLNKEQVNILNGDLVYSQNKDLLRAPIAEKAHSPNRKRAHTTNDLHDMDKKWILHRIDHINKDNLYIDLKSSIGADPRTHKVIPPTTSKHDAHISNGGPPESPELKKPNECDSSFRMVSPQRPQSTPGARPEPKKSIQNQKSNAGSNITEPSPFARTKGRRIFIDRQLSQTEKVQDPSNSPSTKKESNERTDAKINDRPTEKIIRLNRRSPNFAKYSASESPKIIAFGKRPAVFSVSR